MDSTRSIGALLNELGKLSERDLVGYALAAATAFADETGVTAEQLQAVIDESNHEIPKVASRLSDLRTRGVATLRSMDGQKKWKLTPQGLERYGEVTKGHREVPVAHRYLDSNVPDAFYEELVRQINRAYQIDLHAVVLVLARKLLENLLIDLLRKRYKMPEMRIWFDPNRGRFRDFSQLVQELDQRQADFRPITSAIDDGFVSKLDGLRETANANAHSIDVLVTKAQVDAHKEAVTWMVQVLTRTIANTP